jgi:hypothetical protein
MSWEITTINVVEKAECHPFIGSMGSVAIHNDQPSIRGVFGLGLRIVYFGEPRVCDVIIGPTIMRGNKILLQNNAVLSTCLSMADVMTDVNSCDGIDSRRIKKVEP